MSIIPPKKYTISIMIFDGIYSTMVEREFKSFKEVVDILKSALGQSGWKKGEQDEKS